MYLVFFLIVFIMLVTMIELKIFIKKYVLNAQIFVVYINTLIHKMKPHYHMFNIL